MTGTDWYDAACQDDPSTDNVFGREDRAPRRDGVLHEFLKAGGNITHYRPRRRDPTALTALLDRILDKHPLG